MNPVIRAQLRDFARLHTIVSEKQDKQFEIYSIFAVVNGLLGENIDPYDVHLDGDEFGVDGIAILIQGEIVKNKLEAEEKIAAIKNPTIEFMFFQSKTSTSFDYGDISKFFDAVSSFFDGGLKGESAAIDELMGAMAAVYDTGVGRRNPKLSCYYITTGNYEEPSRIEKLRNSFRATLESKNIFESETIKIDMVGARELQQWYRAATSAVEVDIEFPRNVVMPANEKVEEPYIGYIDGVNLLKLFANEAEDHKEATVNRAVFFDNIRDYDKNSRINTIIKESVREQGGAGFVFRNNGITVVSKNIDRTGDKFRLEDYQIVNGCQTSNIIFDLVYGERGALSSKNLQLATSIHVPFRLIASKDDEFVSSIILGTNRQNPVRDDQFWALRPFMKSFEEYCRSLDSEEIIYFERRDNQYRGQDVERTRVMQPAVLMKAVAAALLIQPQRAARDYRGIISEYNDKIFLESHDVRLYHSVAYMYYRTEFLWRNQRIDRYSKTFRYYILAALGLLLASGENVFTVKQTKVAKIAEKSVRFCKNEEVLIETIQSIVKIIERQLQRAGVSGQERIRDAIRSEAFAIQFRKNIISARTLAQKIDEFP